MLYYFKFKNFKSYKDETILDMRAVNTNEFEESLLCDTKGEKILPVAVLYGPNGGGKSGVLEALVFLVSIIIRPKLFFKLNNKEKLSNPLFSFLIEYSPYLFDEESKNNPTEFEVLFGNEKTEFKYGISLLNNKIIEEYLYIRDFGTKKPTKIFERKNNEIDLGDVLKKEKVSIQVNEEVPYLSNLSIFTNIEIVESTMNWFENVLALNYANSNIENKMNVRILEDGKYKNRILKLLENMDIDVSDYRIEKVPSENEESANKIKLILKHNNYELNLKQESEGTKKLFNLLPFIIDILARGGVAIIDELSSKLHPKLIEYTIKLFKNKNINNKNAQLIFSSHDLTTMNRDVFRRDEIWFACKNEENASEIYCLYDIRDEKGERIKIQSAYNKQYIEGRYGADPYLKRILNWAE